MKHDRFYAGGFFYNPKTRSVLLHKRDNKAPVNPDKWGFFGGENEGDEAPVQTFQRELSEELNIEVEKKQIKPLCDYFNQERGIHRYVFLIEGDFDKSKMKLAEGEDFDWISLDKVFEYDLTEKTVRDLKAFIHKI